MINLEKMKKEKCQSPSPFLSRPTPAPYFHPLFLIFKFHPPLGEVIKIYPPTPPLKRGGWGDPNYVYYYSDAVIRF